MKLHRGRFRSRKSMKRALKLKQRGSVSREERDMPLGEKLKLLRAGIIPFLIFFIHPHHIKDLHNDHFFAGCEFTAGEDHLRQHAESII